LQKSQFRPAAAVILLILTESFSQAMVLYDQWTIWHVVIAVVTIVLAILSRESFAKGDMEPDSI